MGVVLVAGLIGLVGNNGLLSWASGVILGVTGVGPAGSVGTLNCECMGGMQKGTGFHTSAIGGSVVLWAAASNGDPNPACAVVLVTQLGLLLSSGE